MFTFRPLRSELSGLATKEQGSHDFDKPVLNPFGTQATFVVNHENVHDNILLRTPFGNFQRIIKQLANADTAKLTFLHPHPQETFELLCDVSELAHESAATYLSIMLEPAKSSQEILNQHPIPYQRYYATLADVIGDIASASYVKYVIARELVDVIFAPPLLDALEKWLTGNEFTLQEWQKPNFRLTQSINAIKRDPTKYRDALRLQVINSAVAPSRADLDACWDSEAWWEAQPIDLIEAIERTMIAEFRKVSVNESRGLFPTIPWDQWERERQIYIEIASRILPSVRTSAQPIGQHVVRPMSYIQRNPNAPSPETLASMKELSRAEDALATDGNLTALVRYKGAQDWIRGVILSGQPGVLKIERFSHELLKRHLLQMRTFALLGAPISILPPLVSSFHSARTDGFAETYNDMAPLLAVQLNNGLLDLGVDSLFWYLHGDLSIWLDFLSRFGKSELIFTIPAEAQAYANQANPGKAADVGALIKTATDRTKLHSYVEAITRDGIGVPSLFFIKTERIIGNFIRFVPFWLLAEVLTLIQTNFTSIAVRNWKDIDEKRQAKIISVGSTLPKIISNLWPEF
jgi:hypothetical protein